MSIPDHPEILLVTNKHLNGKPSETRNTGRTEVNKLIVTPSVVERFAALGAEPLGGTPERAAAFIKGEQEKWGKVIRDAGIKAE